jgi:ADP-ribosylglycohydrolase
MAARNPVLTDLIPFDESETQQPANDFDSAAMDHVFEHKLDSKGNCSNLSQVFRSVGSVMNKYSVVSPDDPDIKTAQALLRDGKFSDPSEDFAFGAVMGLCIGDALGAPLEFSACRYISSSHPDFMTDMQDTGHFGLKKGQWTDDSSMSLCLADSLLVNQGFQPVDSMIRYLHWWNGGYNNAFGFDANRRSYHSVGLGGNIGASMHTFRQTGSAKTPAGSRNTSGNGSLMRLAPLPVYYRDDLKAGMAAARNMSLVTHQGEEAAECCRLVTKIIITALGLPKGDKSFLDNLIDGFHSTEEPVNVMARSDPNTDPNHWGGAHGWNWKSPDWKWSEARSRKQPGYVGSYCMDGLAMALHCVYKTSSFRECMLECVNHCGDADSHGAICGQIAGAIYGVSEIPREWLGHLQKWDNQTIAARAYKLYHKRPVRTTRN